jgi:hypothetical protein
MSGNLQTVGFTGHPSEPPTTVDAEREEMQPLSIFLLGSIS